MTSFYFALPNKCKEFTGFEQLRNVYDKETSFDDFVPLIEYSLKKVSNLFVF